MQMKRVALWMAVLFLSLSFLSPSVGLGAERPAARKAKIPGGSGKAAKTEPAQTSTAPSEASPGQIDARGAVLLEVSTGSLLFEQNADEVIEPASFTKIMTLYLVFQALKQGVIHLNDEVYISEAAWRTGGSKMFVGIGSKVPLEDLLKGIAVVSGNDALVAVAEHVAGSLDAFVDAMNQKAKELGMTRTHFVNPHGLPAEGQVTTPRDMATLDLSYLQHFPESLKYHSIKEISYNGIMQYNRNRLLLRDSTVDGLKTGFVAEAGYHLSATAVRDGMRLLAVVMGAASPSVREREASKLLNYGYRYYTLVQPFPAGQPLKKVKVWKGKKNEVDLYPVESPNFLVRQAQKNVLKWEVQVPDEITAPVVARQPVGQVVFFLSDEPKRTVPLVSQEDIAQGNWFKRVWQTLLAVHKINWRWFLGITGGIALIVIVFLAIGRMRSSSRRSRSFGR